MDPMWAVGLESAEFCSDSLRGCGLPGKGFGNLLSAPGAVAELEWAGKGATVPSMDNVCLSWALLKLLLSSSTVPALSKWGVKHGSICCGTSLKKELQRRCSSGIQT